MTSIQKIFLNHISSPFSFYPPLPFFEEKQGVKYETERHEGMVEGSKNILQKLSDDAVYKNSLLHNCNMIT